MDSRERGREPPAADKPEDVAVLYSWTNLHGAKYHDFSASRREHRAQVRSRAAQKLQEQELLAQSHAEPAFSSGASPDLNLGRVTMGRALELLSAGRNGSAPPEEDRTGPAWLYAPQAPPRARPVSGAPSTGSDPPETARADRKCES